MSKNWQCYKKVGSRWETVMEPLIKVSAEAWVALMWSKIREHEKAMAEAKKAGKKCRHPDPGFREPHCVPV
jgi:hypothetical protein